MDILDDLFSESPAVNAPVAGRFKPRAKAKPKNQSTKASSVAAHSIAVSATEEQPTTSGDFVKDKSDAVPSSSPTKTNDTVDSTTRDEWPGFPDVSFASSSPIRPSTSQTINDISIPFTQQDTGDIQINVEQLEAGDFSCLDAVELMHEAGGAFGKRTSKLKPKPKAQSRAKVMAQTPSDDMGVIDGSVHDGGLNSVLNSSQSGLDGDVSLDPIEDPSQNAVLENTESLATSDMLGQIGTHGEFDGLNFPGNIPDEGPMLSGVETIENTSDFVDGTNDVFDVNSELASNAHGELASNIEENANGVHLEEGKPKKRKRRSKNTALENDKSTGKRKKVAKKSDQSTDQPPKKFPRGTRRKRCVDKSLLEIPEDELDLHRLTFRDVILLGEHREREEKKQGNSVEPVPSNERDNNLLQEGLPYDDDAYEYDQDGDLTENPSTSGVQTDTGYYNYHSFRKIEPRAKWSKMDTEMFYKGIQQFGTDLSMIQQLFPGRSLEQIRSKYRKEQKQNPMMMHDALTSRATDNSCFELVIKTLEAEREAEQEFDSNDENLAQPTSNKHKAGDNSETHAATEDPAKSEHIPKEEEASKEADRPEEDGNPVKSDNDEDDWDDFMGL